MNKSTIIVPKNIRYMSEWSGFEIPDYPCIINKQIPGCGFTEYCICNSENIILCSPRKLLLENKEDQHQGEVFYVRFELDQDVTADKDLQKPFNRSSGRIPTKAYDLLTPDEIKRILENLEKDLTVYIQQCQISGRPIKILVTYDSFRLIRNFLELGGMFQSFRVIIDEFQSIFTDSRFKSGTEIEFVNCLQNVQKVCYVSATPMIDDYLDQIPEFSSLPYYNLDWISDDPLRVAKPRLKALACKSVGSAAYPIIEDYLKGDFELALDRNGKFVYSREAVFYVNSVNNILGIIKKSGLTPEQCNILIAKTPDNERKLERKLGKRWKIGKIPGKGEPHKMFTFCTRTVYLGADFYSTCARTFILSDANIETLAVDISLDLPQIIGRQRNDENPWKNSATFYYKTNCRAISKSEFDKVIALKLDKTNRLLENYSVAPNKLEAVEIFLRDANATNYKIHYIAVNKHAGNNLVPVFNKLVMLSEQRCFDIQQIDYENRFSVFNSIYKSGLMQDSVRSEVLGAIDQINSLLDMRDKIKYLCEADLTENEIGYILDQVPKKCREVYYVLGPARCKALGYNLSNMYKELNFHKTQSVSPDDLLSAAIYSEFQEGEVILLKNIKSRLRKVYESVKYPKTPKAVDIKDYFETQRTRIKQAEALTLIKKL